MCIMVYNIDMRDLHLQTDPKGKWSLDIRVSRGWAESLPDGYNNKDQRTAIMMYFMRGTMPHHREVGVAWGDYEVGSATLVDIDNEIKRNIDAYVQTDGNMLSGIPVYTTRDDGRLGLSIVYPEAVTK